jgi:hypothetical protein
VILAMLDNVTQGELKRYENNYKALNLITTVLCRNCVTLIIALMKLNLLIRILTIGSTKHLLRNLESIWMIALLGLSPL